MIKKVLIDKANRTYQFPPDIFSFLPDNDKPSFIKKTSLLDLGKLHWNVPYENDFKITPASLQKATSSKVIQLKESIADWVYELHKVKINPKNEIYLGGSLSQILFSTSLAFIDPGDLVFVPELGIPLYRKVTTASGGEPVIYSVSSKLDWKPDFKKLSTRIGHVSRLMYLNTPHNPTGCMLNQSELEHLVAIASKENIAVINDASYHSITKQQDSSLISIKNGKKIGLEVYSFSHQFGLPEIPFGFAVGSKELIEGIAQTSSLFSNYIPDYYIDLALDGIRKFPSQNIAVLQKGFLKSKTEAERLFELLDIESFSSHISPFIWGKLSKRKSSNKFCTQLYRKYRILTVPGTVFGNNGEGFIRLSLTASPSEYQQAYARIKKKLSLLLKKESSDE